MKKLSFFLMAMLFSVMSFAQTTVTKTTTDLVTEHSWTVSAGSTIGTLATEFALDEVVTISTSGEANCGTIWGTAPNNDYRLYQNKAGDITITVKSGYQLKTINLTYTINNNGTLLDGITTVASGTDLDVTGLTSKTLVVGNTGSKTNGQVRITQFSVTYVATSGTTEPDPTPDPEEPVVPEVPENLGAKTIAEFLELKNTTDTCVLTGVVANIANTTYGNFDLVDATGSVYVYGLLTAAGESKQFASMDIVAGDTLTVKAIYNEYNGKPQAKNAIYVSHTKTATPIVPENLGAKTIAEFLELKNTTDTCVLTGVVANIANTTYGNFDLVDATGSVYVYGLLTAAGESKQFASMDIAAGDTLTVKAIYNEFNSKPQAKNAIYVSHSKLVLTVEVTETFELTKEDIRDMGGAYSIYAGDDYVLRIYGYNGAGTYQDDPTTEEDEAPELFTPDYKDALDAVVVVTIDEENNKEVMQVTATSADGKKIYNLTINIALPSYETFNFVATGVTAVPETEEGFTTYVLEGEFDYEGTPVPFEFYATTEPATVMGMIGEAFVMGEGENVAFFIEADNSFFLMAKLQDEQGNIYNIEMLGTVAASQDVEIVVAKEENITLYNLNLNVQGNMAMVSAGNDALSFWLTLLPTENYYGGYMNEAFSNIWYGENQLYAAYGDMHLYGDNNGQVMFVVSFITTPDAEGNVTKYNFTLYPGDQPVDSKHTVTILVTPEGAGTVTGAGEYEDGAEVTVTAEENDEYIFMGWIDATGEFLAYDYEYTFQVLEDVTLIAYYLPYLEGESNDLVIGENTLTASAELSIGKLNMNLVLGEEEDGMYLLAETSTVSIDGNEATLLDGRAAVYQEVQMAGASMLVMYNEALYYISVLMVAPETGVDNIQVENVAVKMIKNGQLIINKNGVEYNAQGAILK